MNFEQFKSQESIFRKAEIVDIPIIKKLLQENLSKNLSEEEKEEGFLFYEPKDEELEIIIKDTGIFISLKGDELKGYFMTMSSELAEKLPFINEMIENMDGMEYEDRPIKSYKYAILTQINISKKYRRGTTFFRLHAYTQDALRNAGYEIGVGEVSDTNKNSLDVHRNLVDIGIYQSNQGIKWHVLVVDLRKE